MTEFLIWCVGGAAFGWAAGTVLADPEAAIGGLRDALRDVVVQAGGLFVQGLHGLRRWR